MLKAVPENSTVVGIPGQIVIREGRRLKDEQFDHDNAPDPIAEMLICMHRQINHLEERIAELEKGE